MKLKWKVCGMKDPGNINQVLELEPDYMGFIFYTKSPRFVGDNWPGPGNGSFTRTKKVGVFVNESEIRIRSIAARYRFDYLQLHGDESPDYCRRLYQDGNSIIKAVGLANEKDLDRLHEYQPWVQFFLFDTPSAEYGGTGNAFDWSLLKRYNGELPVILSGGISLENVKDVGKISGVNLAVVDVNSRFEIEPGIKDPQLLKELKSQLKQL